MFNRRTFCFFQIEADKEGSGFQGVGVIIQATLTSDDNNKLLLQQAKCTAIFDIYPRKNLWAVSQVFRSIHKVSPLAKAVPADQGIGSLGTSLDTIKVESLITK